MLEHTKSQVDMIKMNMFITAVCILFLWCDRLWLVTTQTFQTYFKCLHFYKHSCKPLNTIERTKAITMRLDRPVVLLQAGLNLKCSAKVTVLTGTYVGIFLHGFSPDQHFLVLKTFSFFFSWLQSSMTTYEHILN